MPWADTSRGEVFEPYSPDEHPTGYAIRAGQRRNEITAPATARQQQTQAAEQVLAEARAKAQQKAVIRSVAQQKPLSGWGALAATPPPAPTAAPTPPRANQNPANPPQNRVQGPPSSWHVMAPAPRTGPLYPQGPVIEPRRPDESEAQHAQRLEAERQRIAAAGRGLQMPGLADGVDTEAARGYFTEAGMIASPTERAGEWTRSGFAPVQPAAIPAPPQLPAWAAAPPSVTEGDQPNTYRLPRWIDPEQQERSPQELMRVYRRWAARNVDETHGWRLAAMRSAIEQAGGEAWSQLTPEEKTTRIDAQLASMGIADEKATDPITTGEIWEDKDLAELLPVIGGVVTAGKAFEVLDAAFRVERGEATRQDQEMLADLVDRWELADLRGRTVLAGTSTIAAEMPAFIVEMAATGGLYTAGRKVTAEAARRVLKKVLRDSATSRLATRATAAVGGRVAGAGAAAASPVFAGRVATEAAQRMTPGLQREGDPGDPAIAVDPDRPGDGPVTGIAKGYASNVIEVLVERSGGELLVRGGRALGRAAAQRIPAVERARRVTQGFRQWVRQNSGTKTSAFLDDLLKAGGYNGPVPEIAEEYMGQVLRLIALQDPIEPYSAQEVTEMLLAFSAIPAARLTATQAARILGDSSEAGRDRARRSMEQAGMRADRVDRAMADLGEPLNVDRASRAIRARVESNEPVASDIVQEDGGADAEATDSLTGRLLARGYSEAQIRSMDPATTDGILSTPLPDALQSGERGPETVTVAAEENARATDDLPNATPRERVVDRVTPEQAAALITPARQGEAADNETGVNDERSDSGERTPLQEGTGDGSQRAGDLAIRRLGAQRSLQDAQRALPMGQARAGQSATPETPSLAAEHLDRAMRALQERSRRSNPKAYDSIELTYGSGEKLMGGNPGNRGVLAWLEARGLELGMHVVLVRERNGQALPFKAAFHRVGDSRIALINEATFNGPDPVGSYLTHEWVHDVFSQSREAGAQLGRELYEVLAPNLTVSARNRYLADYRDSVNDPQAQPRGLNEEAVARIAQEFWAEITNPSAYQQMVQDLFARPTLRRQLADLVERVYQALRRVIGVQARETKGQRQRRQGNEVLLAVTRLRDELNQQMQREAPAADRRSRDAGHIERLVERGVSRERAEAMTIEHRIRVLRSPRMNNVIALPRGTSQVLTDEELAALETKAAAADNAGDTPPPETTDDPSQPTPQPGQTTTGPEAAGPDTDTAAGSGADTPVTEQPARPDGPTDEGAVQDGGDAVRGPVGDVPPRRREAQQPDESGDGPGTDRTGQQGQAAVPRETGRGGGPSRRGTQPADGAEAHIRIRAGAPGRASIERALIAHVAQGPLAALDQANDTELMDQMAQEAGEAQESFDTSFAGPLPAELRDALQGRFQLLRWFRANVPGGGGEDTIERLGVDRVIEIVSAMNQPKIEKALEITRDAWDFDPTGALMARLLDEFPSPPPRYGVRSINAEQVVVVNPAKVRKDAKPQDAFKNRVKGTRPMSHAAAEAWIQEQRRRFGSAATETVQNPSALRDGDRVSVLGQPMSVEDDMLVDEDGRVSGVLDELPVLIIDAGSLDTRGREGSNLDESGLPDPTAPNAPDADDDIPFAVAATRTAAFQRWQGDAARVPMRRLETYPFQTGRPVVVEAMHGTRDAVWLSSRGVARSHTANDAVLRDGDGAAGGGLMHVYARMRNPLVLDAQRRNWRNVNPLPVVMIRGEAIDESLLMHSPVAPRVASGGDLITLGSANTDEDARLKVFDQMELTARGQLRFFQEWEREAAAGSRPRLSAEQRMRLHALEHMVERLNDAEVQDLEVIGDPTQLSTNEIATRARQDGHDGIVVRNVVDHGASGPKDFTPATIVAVFDPRQIKSATDNRGTFDQDSPDVRFAVAPATRTPEFKRWFGDWEYAKMSRGMRRAEGSDQAKSIVRATFINQPITNQETGLSAVVTGESLRKMMSKSSWQGSVAAGAHYQAIANADRLFESATRYLKRPGNREDDPTQTLHRFAAVMPFEGEPMGVTMIVKEMRQSEQGNRLYQINAVEVEKIKEARARRGEQPNSAVSVPHANPFEDIIDRMAEAVKGSVSKVVHGDGSPRVVYHGMPDARWLNETGVLRTTLERGADVGMANPQTAERERAFFFTDNRAVARTYADDRRAFDYQRAEPGTLEAYLSIRNPMVIDANGRGWGARGGYQTQVERIEAAKAAGHDGMIIENTRDAYDDNDRLPAMTVYVVFDSNQVKSVNNAGSFDPENPDIRFAVGPSSSSPSDDQLRLNLAGGDAPATESIGDTRPMFTAAIDPVTREINAVDPLDDQALIGEVERLRREMPHFADVTASAYRQAERYMRSDEDRSGPFVLGVNDYLAGHRTIRKRDGMTREDLLTAREGFKQAKAQASEATRDEVQRRQRLTERDEETLPLFAVAPDDTIDTDAVRQLAVAAESLRVPRGGRMTPAQWARAFERAEGVDDNAMAASGLTAWLNEQSRATRDQVIDRLRGLADSAGPAFAVGPPPRDQELHDRARRVLGVTHDPNDAGLVLPDGGMLDLQRGRSEHVEHRVAARRVYPHPDHFDDNVPLFRVMRSGVARVDRFRMDSGKLMGYVEVARPLSNQQVRSITRMMKAVDTLRVETRLGPRDNGFSREAKVWTPGTIRKTLEELNRHAPRPDARALPAEPDIGDEPREVMFAVGPLFDRPEEADDQQAEARAKMQWRRSLFDRPAQPTPQKADQDAAPASPQQRGDEDLFAQRRVEPDRQSEPQSDAQAMPPDAEGSYSMAEHAAMVKAAQAGTMTLERWRQGFERVVEHEDAIKAELATRTMKQLAPHGSGGRKKAEVIDSVFDNLKRRYLLGQTYSVMIGFGDRQWRERTLQAQRATLSKLTQGDLDAYSSDYQARQAELRQALNDPQDLSQFGEFIRIKGESALTDEQRERYAALRLEQSRGEDRVKAQAELNRRQRELEQRGTVERVDAGTPLSVSKHYHTKRDTDVWVVSMADRVDRDTYNAMNIAAKRMGGWYARKFGNTPAGFMFTSEADAQRLIALQNGDQDVTDRLEAREDARTARRGERLHEVAARIRQRAEASLNQDRLTNTARRVAMNRRVEAQARRDVALANVMDRIAQDVESGDAPLLSRVRAATEVERLRQALVQSRRDQLQAARRDGGMTQDEFDRRWEAPFTESDIDAIQQYPYPKVYADHLRGVAQTAMKTKGVKQAGGRLYKKAKAVIDRHGPSAFARISDPRDLDALRNVVGQLGNDSAAYWLGQETADFQTLQRLGLTDLSLLREGLRQYLPAHLAGNEQAPEADPIHEAERELVGMKIPGFFPTPESVLDLVVREADIQSGHRVLEPSAGKGDMAERAMAVEGATVHAIERHHSLRDVLTMKQIDLVGSDFMDFRGHFEAPFGYDRVLMNPPFENDQDIAHVMHAYDLLAPGGRLVAVMSGGTLSRSRGAAPQFRDWLNERDGVADPLPEGSFASAFRPTGVSTILVTIDKPGTPPVRDQAGPAFAVEPASRLFAEPEPSIDRTDPRKGTGQLQYGLHPNLEGDLRERMRHTRHRQSNLFAFDVPNETRWERFRRGLQDRFLPLRKVQDAVARQGGFIGEDSDAYLAEELMHGRAGQRRRDLDRRFIQPIIDAIAREKLTVDDVDLFLYARHAPERNLQVAKVNQHFRESGKPGSGLPTQEAHDILNGFEQRGMGERLRRVAQLVDDLIRERERIVVSSGLESQDMVDQWLGAYRFYVPLRANPDNESNTHPLMRTGFSLETRGQISERALGGVDQGAVQPLSYAILQAEHAVVQAEKNAVGQALLRFVLDNPDENLWEVNKNATKPKFDEATGTVVMVTDPRWKQEAFAVKDGGKEYFIEFKQPELKAAMKGLEVEQINTFVRAFAAMGRWFARINTHWNPEFIPTNLSRDVLAAAANIGIEANAGFAKDVLKSVPSAMHGALRAVQSDTAEGYWVDRFRQFEAAGGRIDFFGFRSIDQVGKDVERRLKNANAGTLRRVQMGAIEAAQLIGDLNTAVENAVRVAAFDQAIKRGFTERQSASLARNLTVNFNRRGEWTSVMGAWYVFFNASVQGNVRLLQALKKRKGRATALVGGIVAMGATLDTLNRLIGGEDEDGVPYYDKMSDHTKSHNLIVPLGNGNFFTLPLPYGYNVFHTLGVEASAIGHGVQTPTRAAGHLGLVAMNSFSPVGGEATFAQQVAPTILDPAIQLSENTNFMGSPIKPFNYNNRPTSELYFETASPSSVEITRFLNEITGGDAIEPGVVSISPEAIDHWREFLTGGLGRFLQRSVDAGRGALAGELPTLPETPILRRFLTSPRPGRIVGDFYDHQRALDVVRRKQRYFNEQRQIAAASGDGRRVAAMDRQLGELTGQRGWMLNASLLDPWNRMTQRVRELNEEIASTVDRDRIDALDEQRLDVMMDANKVFQGAKREARRARAEE